MCVLACYFSVTRSELDICFFKKKAGKERQSNELLPPRLPLDGSLKPNKRKERIKVRNVFKVTDVSRVICMLQKFQ